MPVVTFQQPIVKPVLQAESIIKKKRIGILGGTFNPPHIGHLIIAEQVYEQLGLEKILFMPDANPPHVDHKEAIAAQHRQKMVKASIKDNPHFELEDCELKRGGVSYTFDTIKQLLAKHPEYEIYFIIGGDMVAYLPKWHRIDELVKLVHFVGVKRVGFPLESKYPIMWVDIPLIQISSTGVRQRVVHNQSIRYLVPSAVQQYIQKEGLYREKN
ncbi:MAG: nicotinate-nucleotide adenylyltransferase [Liquorilactobacillus nagelii]|uniref:nicotinate-nucleotide adenylyltransferase n=1 Tax=Liquorilactobacillus nagelii TaxID=82688 RepID=UPI00242AE993|nr:nicotinate-nucleotide adenylyltransferase [Liquorilactobacillus nagelii]MCI1920314.1 nicotinate-nucleotide adenylyltransferase [Liquorilactobacillus nagelii]MCI1975958.1 nicotinate-nucleotide adenylyltransferase [Liquorilactobacillus nagelii]